MTNVTKLTGAIKYALFVGAASMAVTGLAVAQEQAEEETAEATTLERIEVTGSRLKRAEIEGATPVAVIDRATIDASGDVSVADVLRDATFASFGNFRPQSGSSAQSLATVDLRGLGSDRTLVLIDGRRAPTAPMAASAGADLNAIPLAAVERIEILSDGASAVYGSDAIGGVVNIILRKDFNGAELRYGIGKSQVKGGDTSEASAVFGVSSDRGRLIGGASLNKRGMVFTRDQIGYTRGISTYGNNYYNWNTGSASPVPGFACDSNAFYRLANGNCSFDFNSVAANEAKINNKALFVRGDYSINDDWTVYTTASVTQVESFGRYAPVPGIFSVDDGTPNDINDGVSCTTVDCSVTGATDGLPTYFYHRFAAAGNRDNFVDSTNADFLLGFQGQLTDTVGVDFGLRQTNYSYIETGRGYIVRTLAQQAANTGDYLVTDPFGASADTLAGFTATIGRDAHWKTDELFASVNFDLFEMGGGTSNAVVGAEYRQDDYQDIYDSLSRAGVVLGSSGGSAAGTRTAKAAYAEWLLPFSSTFDITLAGRYDTYSDYGSDFSPKVAFRWQPFETLTFRGSYGEGFKAPGLDILTQALTFSAEPVRDPQTCVATGAAPDCTVQVDTYFQANPDLSSEQSKQFSLGLVYDPFEWMDVSLDYYNIELTDRISSISATEVINCTLDPGTYGACPPGVSLTRNAAGRITRIDTGYANQGLIETSGLDLRANTRFDLGDMGRLSQRFAVSYVNNFEIEDSTGELIEQIGLLGVPEMRAGLQNHWAYGDISVDFNSNFIEGQERSATATRPNLRVGGYTTHDLQFSVKTPWNGTVALGATNIGNKYPALVPYDGRPFNFYLYDAYGRTVYMRYTQQF